MGARGGRTGRCRPEPELNCRRTPSCEPAEPEPELESPNRSRSWNPPKRSSSSTRRTEPSWNPPKRSWSWNPAGRSSELERLDAESERSSRRRADDGPMTRADRARSTEPDPLVTPPEMSQMLFVDVVLLLPATHPVVVLQEADPPYRELRIPVGGAEGIAIGYAARGLETPRPLTHELLARHPRGVRDDARRRADHPGTRNGVYGRDGHLRSSRSPRDRLQALRRDRTRAPPPASGADHGSRRSCWREPAAIPPARTSPN